MFALRTCRALPAFLVALVLASPLAAQDSSLANEIERLRRDMNTLQSYVYRGDKKAIGPTQGGEARPDIANRDAVSRLQVQVQELRRRMREINGTFEEMDHRIARLSERFDKLVGDVDLRLRALESGRVSSGEDVSSGQRGRNGAGADGTTALRSDETTSGSEDNDASGLQPGQKPFGTLSQDDVSRLRGGEGVTASRDRPNLPSGIGSDSSQTGPRSPSSPQSVPPSSVTTTGPNSGSQTASLPQGTPEEQYDHAYNLLLRRDLPEAEVALRTFVERHPKHELADNAIFWLGETHYAREQYKDAIRVYYDAYRTYPKGNKAPDVLLKLGMSLGTIGEKDSACSAYEELTSAHPKANPRILDTAKRERQSLGCE